MQISRPYTVVLPSLQVDPSEREFDGRRFYLMIKLYPEGTLTPTLNPVVAGEFHNFQHSPSVLGGLLPPWVFKSKTMSLKLWLTVKEFSLLKKICINDGKTGISVWFHYFQVFPVTPCSEGRQPFSRYIDYCQC